MRNDDDYDYATSCAASSEIWRKWKGANATVMSFVLFGRLEGLGVGTVVAAAITGQIVNFLNRHIHFVSAVERQERPAKAETK
ncbi:hypothetical protein COO72_11590 [Bifidobacterium callitrichos]|nr:hypothetical protein COO72_11590 [Bifidobacterium callitrichos]